MGLIDNHQRNLPGDTSWNLCVKTGRYPAFLALSAECPLPFDGAWLQPISIHPGYRVDGGGANPHPLCCCIWFRISASSGEIERRAGPSFLSNLVARCFRQKLLPHPVFCDQQSGLCLRRCDEWHLLAAVAESGIGASKANPGSSSARFGSWPRYCSPLVWSGER